MKHKALLAVLLPLVAATVVGCGGSDSDDTAVVPAPSSPGATVQALYDYTGTWVEHDERCEWNTASSQYDKDVDVITRVGDGVFQRQEITHYYADAQCAGAVVRSAVTSEEYWYVVGQGQLADGTAVDQIHETAQAGGAVREKCVAFVQGGALLRECNDADEAFPTAVDRTEWDVKQ
ncbi:MAG: hypothetical protein Q4F13_02140 [Pseudomonadota bacterium]|nr:hypothetical protein [Pseudomonadota bacterium]